jgi:hypothetical protein
VRSALWGLLLACLLGRAAWAQTTVGGPEAPTSGYVSLGVGRPMSLSEQGLRGSVVGNALRAPRGFTPLEVTLYNPDSVPRPVLLAFQSHDSSRSQVARREVEVGPRQRLVTHLYVPAVVRSGTLRMRSPETVSDPVPMYFDEAEGAAVLVLGAEQAFEAATGLFKVTASPMLTARFVELADAPRELAGYVGYPSVVVAGETAALSAEVWAALEAYAAVGGRLVLTRPPRDVAQYLPLLSTVSASSEVHRYGFGQVRLCEGVAACGRGLSSDILVPEPLVKPAGAAPSWQRSSLALRDGAQPLLPGARAPVGRFLFLITLFALAVGPGGLLLARRKGPVALLVAVPSVAFVTCLAIIAWSVLVDGFSTQSSRYSVTLLDRARSRAVVLGLGSYYANLARDDLRLPALGVLLAPEQSDDQLAEADWTNGMTVVGGFLPSRTYREWGEAVVLPTRARLSVRREGEALRVQNALGTSIETGYVKQGGEVWRVVALAEGAEAMAMPLPDSEREIQVANLTAFNDPVAQRFAGLDWSGLRRPLQEGEFLVHLGGSGWAPTAAMPVELHEGRHFVRGQVDGP